MLDVRVPDDGEWCGGDELMFRRSSPRLLYDTDGDEIAVI